jgi:hypothetical protein
MPPFTLAVRQPADSQQVLGFEQTNAIVERKPFA